jgi:hypothetical protein
VSNDLTTTTVLSRDGTTSDHTTAIAPVVATGIATGTGATSREIGETPSSRRALPVDEHHRENAIAS